MGNRSWLCSLTLLLYLAPAVPAAVMQQLWLVNNTTNIGGLPAARIGDPRVIDTPYGAAVWFNGATDGLKLATNPLAGLTNFTVEMIFRPDPSTRPSSRAPRIFHIQSPEPPDHRLTLEARVSSNAWYGDTFLRTSASNSLTLADSNRTHAAGGWYQLSVTYDGTVFRQYVNTALELTGELAASPLVEGQCSIGMRANTNSFFEGAIRALRFTGRVLATHEFLCVPRGTLQPPEFSRGWIRLEFQISSGLPLGLALERAARPPGPWTHDPGKIPGVDQIGARYLWSIPADEPAQYFRVVFP